MYNSEKEPPSYQDSQSSVTDPCTLLMSPPPDCIAGIAYALNVSDHFRWPPQQYPTTNPLDEGSPRSGGPTPFFPFYSVRPFGPPHKGSVLSCDLSESLPPAARWSPSNYMSSKDSSHLSSPTYRDIGVVHSPPGTAQSVKTPTPNVPCQKETPDSSTDEHDGDLQEQISQHTYRRTVSTLAIQRAASHRRKHKARFLCPHEKCDSRFTTARNLQNHENSHRNAKNYICSVCHMAMATRSNVLRHGKKQHPGMKIRAEQRA